MVQASLSASSLLYPEQTESRSRQTLKEVQYPLGQFVQNDSKIRTSRICITKLGLLEQAVLQAPPVLTEALVHSFMPPLRLVGLHIAPTPGRSITSGAQKKIFLALKQEKMAMLLDKAVLKAAASILEEALSYELCLIPAKSFQLPDR
eukprot:scaffold81879_cov14-Tisochrysis_lutea.AAC.2